MRKLWSKYLVAIVITLLLQNAMSGCSSKSKSGSFSQEDIALPSETDLQSEQNRWSGDSAIPQAMKDGVFNDIHFEYSSSEISDDAREELKRNAKVMIADPSLRVEIEGHCDSRGTKEFNLALGQSRAKTIATILISHGVPTSQISTISYGEEIPLDPSESEEAYAKNRRVHFAVFRSKSGALPSGSSQNDSLDNDDYQETPRSRPGKDFY